jgi:hypothetical protein
MPLREHGKRILVIAAREGAKQFAVRPLLAALAGRQAPDMPHYPVQCDVGHSLEFSRADGSYHKVSGRNNSFKLLAKNRRSGLHRAIATRPPMLSATAGLADNVAQAA